MGHMETWVRLICQHSGGLTKGSKRRQRGVTLNPLFTGGQTEVQLVDAHISLILEWPSQG